MKTNTLTRAGVALVTGAAACSIFLSQGAFAQGEGESGFAALIGRERIRADDPRFEPAAMLVMNEASRGGSPGRGKTVISETVLTDFFSKYIVSIPQSARAADPRNLKPAEAALLEELFSQNLKKSRGTEITNHGLSGSVRPNDVDIKPQELMQKAKARAAAKSKWYGEGAQGLGPG